MTIRTRDRGAALLLSLAVLAILSMLALSFIRGTSNEREAASNYAISVRAKLNAEAGIQRAIGALQEITVTKPYSDRAGYKTDGTRIGDSWIYLTNDGAGVGNESSTPLLTSLFPSLPFDKDGDGKFENGVVGSSSDDLVYGRAVSGIISDPGPGAPSGVTGPNYGAGNLDSNSQFDPDGMVYKLRVRDTSAGINLNSKQANLATILDLLGKAIEEVELYNPIAGRGAALVTFRDAQPNGILRDLDELVGNAGFTAEDVNTLRNYLTTHSWQDTTTIKPDPHKDPKTLPSLVAEPRYPVNINTAPEAVIKALVAELKGYEFTFVEQETVYKGTAAVIDEKTETAAITWAQAGKIAAEIVKARKTTPFRTWDQFKNFILSDIKAAVPALTAGQLDVLRANFNPNTLASRFNPQRVRAHKVSKFDLTRYSIEFSFGPGGYFEIESLGLVTARKGMIVSRARYTTLVQVSDIVRHTTQAQFESNAVSGGSSRTVSYPDSIADLGSGGSLYDGQIEMFTKPKVDKPATTSTFCIRITSTSSAKKSTNHIQQVLPAAIKDKAAASATNNKGWKVNAQSSDYFGYGQGFKFTPGSLGGKGKIDTLEYCFTIPKGSVSSLTMLTKVGSAKKGIATTTISLTPPDYSPKTDTNGFKVELVSTTDKDEDGTVVTGTPPSFHAPFVDRFDAVTGGSKAWVGDKGVKKKKEDVGVFSGSSLLPDGMLSMRSLAQELGYKASSNLASDTGAVEFWIKMVGDGTTGSNESLFYVVHPSSYKSNGEFASGIIHKLIRYEDEVISSRAFVGHPSGVSSPYALSYSEAIGKIGKWKDHEWHHIALSWYDGVDHDLYIDGKIASKVKYSASSYTFRLGSNEPVDHFSIGGFEFYSPSGASIFNRGTIIVAGQNERFSNSTISDVRIYNTRQFSGASFSVDDRFTTNPVLPAKWHGKFVLSRTYPVTIGAVSWTEYKPKAYKDTVLGDGDTDVGVEIRISKADLAGSTSDYSKTVPTDAASGGDGRGHYLGKSLKASSSGTDPRTVEYVLTFTSPSGLDPMNVTPSVDDIQLTLTLSPARVIHMKQASD